MGSYAAEVALSRAQARSLRACSEVRRGPSLRRRPRSASRTQGDAPPAPPPGPLVPDLPPAHTGDGPEVGEHPRGRSEETASATSSCHSSRPYRPGIIGQPSAFCVTGSDTRPPVKAWCGLTSGTSDCARRLCPRPLRSPRHRLSRANEVAATIADDWLEGRGVTATCRLIQGLVPARVWGFESPLRHHRILA